MKSAERKAGFAFGLALWSVVMWAGCGPAPAPPKLVDSIDVTDYEGQPTPVVLSRRPAEHIELLLVLTPAAIDSSQFKDRPPKPPEQWRFRTLLRKESGEPAEPAGFVAVDEFYDFETIAIQKIGKDQKPVWISPAKPPGSFKDRIVRWGMVRAPAEPGKYEIAIVAYPTATPRGANVEVWGEGQPIWTNGLEVSPAVAEEKVEIPDSMSVGVRQRSPIEAALRKEFEREKKKSSRP